MQNYLRSKVHLMFMAASSVTRYFRTNGNATRVTVWDDMHVRQMTWPRPYPARRAITMSGCLVQALPASHGILGTPFPVQVWPYLAFDGAYPRPNSFILPMAVNPTQLCMFTASHYPAGAHGILGDHLPVCAFHWPRAASRQASIQTLLGQGLCSCTVQWLERGHLWCW